MPEVPDVAILHCGIMPHMKMGIKVNRVAKIFQNYIIIQLNNFKNFDDGSCGRILSYNDLTDRRDYTQKKKKNEDEDSDDEEAFERRRIEEEQERAVRFFQGKHQR